MSNPDPFKANQPEPTNPQPSSPQPADPFQAQPTQPQPIQTQPIQTQPIQTQPIQAQPQPMQQPVQSIPTMMPHSAPPINPYASPTIEGGQWGQPQSGVSAQTVELLRETKPWVFLVSGVGIVGAFLLVIAGLIMLFYRPSGMGRVPDDVGELAAGGIAYLVMGALQFAGAMLLIRYGQAISGLMGYPASEQLDSAMRAQKSFWRFTGIVMLTGTLLFVAAIVSVIIFAAARA